MHNGSEINAGAQHEQPTESTVLQQHAEQLIDSLHTFDDDRTARESAIKEKTRLLAQAYGFLFGNGEHNDAEPVDIATLKATEWERVEKLAALIEQVNAMPWEHEKDKQHCRAKRLDGSLVSVPYWYFPHDMHRISLREVNVNTKDGFTIFDVLQAIIDPNSSASRKISKELHGS